MADFGRLRGPLAIVGLSVTDARPALIYEISIGHMTDGILSGTVWTRHVQPDTKEADIPPRARPLVSKAPPWPEVVGWVVETIGHRRVVFRDPTAYQVLRAHLPDQKFAGVLYAWNIGRETWPDLYKDLPESIATSSAQVFGMCGMINAILVHAGLVRASPLTSEVKDDD
jgi:hypothetical protein